ncbi:MAG: hypothetical protein IKB37_02240 [Rikenellaceae bacterium]|nr:hypothetical protein [Rikenellaceae bacterium]
MRKSINNIFDWAVIIVGGITLILALFGVDNDFLKLPIIISFGIVLYWLVRAFLLFVYKRPLFDWHLINGNFLRKICCLILLMPFALTGISAHFIDSPKELAYEDNLYECGDQGVPCVIKHKQESPNLFWSTYYHFLDPGNQHMTTSQNGRGWSALIAILGVFLLNGLLVSSIVGWIDSRKEKWLKGEVKYPCFLRRTKHYVIIGGNDMAISIVKQIFTTEYSKTKFSQIPYIIIQTSRDVEEFRRELFSELPEQQQQHVIILYGSRTSKKDLSLLGLNMTKEIYILGEEPRTDDIESYHDTMNMKCLALLRELYEQTPKGRKISDKIEKVNTYKYKLSQAQDDKALRNDSKNKALDEWWKNRPRLNCRVMFEYQTSFSVFQFFDIDESMDTYVKFTPFNYYELWAQNVFINKHIDIQKIKSNFKKGKYLPLEGFDGIKANDETYVHLFIVGLSRMGVAMAIEAAHLCHYPNFTTKGLRTKITFIDKNATKEKNFFMGRFKELFDLSNWRYGEVHDANNWITWDAPHKPSNYKYLGGDFIDIEWEFINGGIESSAIQNYILMSANPMAKLTIAICLPESNRSHAAALYLDKRIYKSSSVLQVLSYNRYGDSIVNAISNGCSEYPFRGKLRGFGCAEQCNVIESLTLSEEIGEHIAKAYAEGETQHAINPESTYSGKSNTANNWSSIYNGNTLWTKLRCIEFDEEACILNKKDINVLANVEHNRWNVEELLMNFRYLEEDEQEMVMNGEKKKKNLKKEMAHLDICSNNRLEMIDRGIRKYDVLLTECLGDIYKNLKKKT